MNHQEEDIKDLLGRWEDDSKVITVHTSGTTGKPKPIDLLKEHMRNSAIMTGKFLGLEPGNKALLALPVKYIAGKMMVIRSQVLGLELITTEATSSPTFSSEVDFAALTPMQVGNILDNDPESITRIKKLIIGGAPLTVDIEKRLLALGVDAWETYGMTETITHIALRRIGTPAFEALPGVFLNEDERSCLKISCDKIGVDQLQTNDIVDLKDAGMFIWKGRYDHVINTGGIKVSPEEVERKLTDILSGYDYIISHKHDDQLGQKVVLLIEGIKLDEAIKKMLHSEIEEEVEDKYHRPKEIYSIDSFERTETGKIKRRVYIDHSKDRPTV